MLVTFSKEFPEPERAWVAALISQCARLWGFDTWEFQVSTKRFRVKSQCAEVVTNATTSVARIALRKDRLNNRLAVRDDLVHELWHLLDDELWDTFDDLAAHIPDEGKRRRARNRAEKRYEAWHDRTSRIVGRLIVKLGDDGAHGSSTGL